MEGGLILFVAALVLLASPAVSMLNNPPVVTRTGCGTPNKQCLETPKGCDPTGAGPCLFVSAVFSAAVPRGTNLTIQLQGESTGYIAVGQSESRATTFLFVCGQNKTSFFFKTVTRDDTNNMLYETPAPFQATFNSGGSVNGNRIACEFDILDLNAAAINGILSSINNPASSSFALLLGTGMLTEDNALGPFNVKLNTSDPTPTPTPTPAPFNSTTHSAAGQPHAALLLPLGVLSLSALLSGRS